MLAQSLVEYGLLATLAQTAQHARDSVGVWLGSLSSRDWATVGAVVLIGLALRTFLRSR